MEWKEKLGLIFPTHFILQEELSQSYLSIKCPIHSRGVQTFKKFCSKLFKMSICCHFSIFSLYFYNINLFSIKLLLLDNISNIINLWHTLSKCERYFNSHKIIIARDRFENGLKVKERLQNLWRKYCSKKEQQHQ